MMDVKELLPQHKSDDSQIKELLALPDDQIAPVMMDLLTWLQDINWPVAPQIVKVIVRHQAIAEPHISNVLRGTDDVWKYNIISALLCEWDTRPGNELFEEVIRIARNPTSNEIAEEVNLAAADFIANYTHQEAGFHNLIDVSRQI